MSLFAITLNPNHHTGSNIDKSTHIILRAATLFDLDVSLHCIHWQSETCTPRVAREKYSGGSTNPEKQYSMKGKPRNP
jgi:hypothetical protein